MRADRLPAGVMTVPVFCSMGVPLADRGVAGVLTGVAGATFLDFSSNSTPFDEDACEESLDKPKTAKKPSNAI